MGDTPTVADKFRAKHGNGTGWVPTDDNLNSSNVIALVLDSPKPGHGHINFEPLHILLDCIASTIDGMSNEEIEAFDTLAETSGWQG